MKKIIAVATVVLLTSNTWAHDKVFGGNPDMYQSPLLDHTPSKMGYKPEIPSSYIDPETENLNFLIENQKHTVHKHETYDPKAYNANYDDPDGVDHLFKRN